MTSRVQGIGAFSCETTSSGAALRAIATSASKSMKPPTTWSRSRREILQVAMFFRRNQSEVAFGQRVAGSRFGNCADDRNRTDRFDRAAQNLFMPAAVHIVQNHASDGNFRIEFLASEDLRGGGAGHLGGVHDDHHRRFEIFAEHRAAVGTGDVEAVV